jgi:hypothetical protein
LAEIEQALVECIAKKAHNHKAVNQTELLNDCTKNLDTAIIRGWVDSFLSRYADESFEMKSPPQRKQRLDVPRAFFEAGTEDIKTDIQNACAALPFNLDEIGISEWENRIKK